MSQLFISGGQSIGASASQAGIMIAGGNISNLRYADDITHMAESEEELKSLLMKVKVSQSCPNLCNHVDCSPPGSPVHGIL